MENRIKEACEAYRESILGEEKAFNLADLYDVMELAQDADSTNALLKAIMISLKAGFMIGRAEGQSEALHA